MLRRLFGMSPSPNQQLKRSSRKLFRALKKTALLWKEETPCYAVAHFPVKNLCMIQFFGLARPDRISFWTSVPIRINVDRCDPELLLKLLKRNPHQDFGRYGLQETAQGLTIVQTEVFSTRLASVDAMARVANILVSQTEDLVYQLYAEGLINRISDWYDDRRGYA